MIKHAANTENTEKYPCSYAKKCGGCSLMNLSYKDQLRLKEKRVRTLCGEYCKVEHIIPSPSSTHYRCKTQFAFAGETGRLTTGIYQSGSHRVVPIDHCLIDDKDCDDAAIIIRKTANDFGLEAYDAGRRTGLLRHILIRKGFNTNELMIVLVTGHFQFPHKTAFVEAIIKNIPSVGTIVQNINGERTSMVLGEKTIVLYGKGYITDRIGKYEFKISPKSFYQINPPVAAMLYSYVADTLKLNGTENILDAYCGTGTIGIFISENAKSVTGVETVKDAVSDAIENARLNGCKNTSFVCADAGAFAHSAAKSGKRFDIVIMDPPRAGSTAEFIENIADLVPASVIYISCNPETLKRDLAYFKKRGYVPDIIQPFDMFPYTDHVETVCCLYHQKKDFISVPYEPKDADHMKQLK